MDWFLILLIVAGVLFCLACIRNKIKKQKYNKLLEKINQSSLIHDMIKNGNITEFKRVVEIRVYDINRMDGLNQTPLHLATLLNRHEHVKILLNSNDIDVNIINNLDANCDFMKSNELLLVYFKSKYLDDKIVKSGDSTCYDEFIINYSVFRGKTPLELAIYFNHTEIIQLLLDKGMCSAPPLYTDVVKETSVI
jgi:ankyrin repeat protein